MKARCHLYISGRVQGVAYRAFTHDVAWQLNLNGWVRNLADGRVEALFEGERAAVEQAVGRCEAGPPMSRVDRVWTEWEDFRGDLPDFEVRPTAR